MNVKNFLFKYSGVFYLPSFENLTDSPFKVLIQIFDYKSSLFYMKTKNLKRVGQEFLKHI